MNEQNHNRIRFGTPPNDNKASQEEAPPTSVVESAMETMKKFATEKPIVVVAVGLAVGIASGWLLKRK